MRRDLFKQARALWADDDVMAGSLVAFAFFVCLLALIGVGFF